MRNISLDLIVFGALGMAWRAVWKMRRDLAAHRQFQLRAEARRAEAEQRRRGEGKNG